MSSTLKLILEHAKVSAEFVQTADSSLKKRIHEIENDLGMTSEDIARKAIEHYSNH